MTMALALNNTGKTIEHRPKIVPKKTFHDFKYYTE